LWFCDANVLRGDEPARVCEKIADMSAHRERLHLAPMKYGVAAYTIVRSTGPEAKQSWRALPTSNNPAPVTRITSNGWRARNWSSKFHSKITPYWRLTLVETTS